MSMEDDLSIETGPPTPEAPGPSITVREIEAKPRVMKHRDGSAKVWPQCWGGRCPIGECRAPVDLEDEKRRRAAEEVRRTAAAEVAAINSRVYHANANNPENCAIYLEENFGAERCPCEDDPATVYSCPLCGIEYDDERDAEDCNTCNNDDNDPEAAGDHECAQCSSTHEDILDAEECCTEDGGE